MERLLRPAVPFHWDLFATPALDDVQSVIDQLKTRRRGRMESRARHGASGIRWQRKRFTSSSWQRVTEKSSLAFRTQSMCSSRRPTATERSIRSVRYGFARLH